MCAWTLGYNEGFIIADEAALKQVFEPKGASGLRMCFLCKNAIQERSQLAEHDRTGFLVGHAEHDLAKYSLRTDESLWNDLARRHATMRVGAFDLRQKALGVNFAPHGVLFDASLRRHVGPVTGTMWDWLHTYLVGGVFVTEMKELMRELKGLSLDHTHVLLGYIKRHGHLYVHATPIKGR